VDLRHTTHRGAAVLTVALGALTVAVAAHYLREHGGWDLRSASSELMTLLLLLLGFVFMLAVALLRPSASNPRGSRLTSLVLSLALLAALLFTWHIIIVGDRWDARIGTPLTSPEDVAAFAAEHPTSVKRYTYQVPTGVFLQSFEFVDSHNVNISGYVWQFYSADIPADVTRGVVFPEALGQAYTSREAWRFTDDKSERIGWYFSGTFRQDFDYHLYPFDRQAIWLRLWHPDPEREVLLVPDFSSYPDISPATLPGIEHGFVYGGWDPAGAGFSYNLVSYTTNFGLADQLTAIPSLINLYFSLWVTRDYLGPLLEHLVLETAIASLLFVLLVLTARGGEGPGQIGVGMFDLAVAAGGLLFAVILDHNAIRNAIESQALTYLEWFPLILAGFIVLVVLSALLRQAQWRLPLLGYTGDLMPVLAYWPALLGSLLAITLLVFFS
jgi:hypothetical protein